MLFIKVLVLVYIAAFAASTNYKTAEPKHDFGNVEHIKERFVEMSDLERLLEAESKDFRNVRKKHQSRGNRRYLYVIPYDRLDEIGRSYGLDQDSDDAEYGGDVEVVYPFYWAAPLVFTYIVLLLEFNGIGVP